MTSRTEINVTRHLVVSNFGSQMEASRRLHFHERTVRWWCKNGAPPHVVATLRRLLAEEISLRWARELLRAKRSRREYGRRRLNGRRRA